MTARNTWSCAESRSPARWRPSGRSRARVRSQAGELLDVEAQFAAKYQQTEAMWHDGRHGWLKLTPTKIVSWDFRKIEPRT